MLSLNVTVTMVEHLGLRLCWFVVGRIESYEADICR
jgi:hypothetical protein